MNAKWPSDLWRQDGGKDLIEYSLLLAFVAPAATALLIQGGQAISSIWGQTSNQLQQASSVASS